MSRQIGQNCIVTTNDAIYYFSISCAHLRVPCRHTKSTAMILPTTPTKRGNGGLSEIGVYRSTKTKNAGS